MLSRNSPGEATDRSVKTRVPLTGLKRLKSSLLKAFGAILILVAVTAAGFVLGILIESPPEWSVLNFGQSDAEFERRLERFLVDNPELIADAFERYAAQQSDSDQISRAPGTVRTPGTLRPPSRAVLSRELLGDPDSPVGGNPNGDVTLVEFFDYNCPYCRAVLPTLKDLLATDRKLRFVYKEFPILTDGSRFAARAALAARNQGKYLEFHDALMSAGGIINERKVIEVARRVGLNIRRLRRDMKDPEIQAAIDRNLALAQSLNISGTPSFVIGERIFRGAADLATLQALIERER